MLSKGKSPKGGLSSAMGEFKLKFDGQAHRADVDAMNTLELFFHILSRQQMLNNIVDTARNVK